MSVSLTIEPMKKAHLEKVSEIENAVSPHPWTINQFAESLTKQHCYVLSINNQVSGFLIFSLVARESELFNIAVASTQQGFGYGRKLLKFYLAKIAGHASRALLEVRSDNDVARELYDKSGYIITGRRKGYYRIAGMPVDALLMSLDLESNKVGHV